jgi:fructokinase
MQYGISVCDILKISDDELSFVTGCAAVEDGVNALRKISPARLILVTMGKKGSRAFFSGVHVEKETFTSLRAVDTTGAGDTFCGCALDFALDHDLDNLKSSELADMLLFANAAASIVTTRKGALRVMPERSEITALLGSLSGPR